MLVIVELDGPVIEIEPTFWAAYSIAVDSIGLARTDPRTYWRLVRKGAPDEKAILGAKPRHISKYRATFDKAIESDACLDQSRGQLGAAGALERLRRRARCLGISRTRNTAARLRVLDGAGLEKMFDDVVALSDSLETRSAELRSLIGSAHRVVVVASSVDVARAASVAEMFVVGVASGCCTGRRLMQMGAQIAFADLDELADEIENGCERLVKLGLRQER